MWVPRGPISPPLLYSHLPTFRLDSPVKRTPAFGPLSWRRVILWSSWTSVQLFESSPAWAARAGSGGLRWAGEGWAGWQLAGTLPKGHPSAPGPEASGCASCLSAGVKVLTAEGGREGGLFDFFIKQFCRGRGREEDCVRLISLLKGFSPLATLIKQMELKRNRERTALAKVLPTQINLAQCNETEMCWISGHP